MRTKRKELSNSLVSSSDGSFSFHQLMMSFRPPKLSRMKKERATVLWYAAGGRIKNIQHFIIIAAPLPTSRHPVVVVVFVVLGVIYYCQIPSFPPHQSPYRLEAAGRAKQSRARTLCAVLRGAKRSMLLLYHHHTLSLFFILYIWWL